jgi:hypothetical protein
MTNKLVVILNSLKIPKIKKILLYEMKFLVRNYSCLQNSWLGGYRPQISVLSVLCPHLKLLNPPEKNSWVRHWIRGCTILGSSGTVDTSAAVGIRSELPPSGITKVARLLVCWETAPIGADPNMCWIVAPLLWFGEDVTRGLARKERIIRREM